MTTHSKCGNLKRATESPRVRTPEIRRLQQTCLYQIRPLAVKGIPPRSLRHSAWCFPVTGASARAFPGSPCRRDITVYAIIAYADPAAALTALLVGRVLIWIGA